MEVNMEDGRLWEVPRSAVFLIGKEAVNAGT